MVEHPERADALRGRTLYIPSMCAGSSRIFAGAFRSLGIEARATPPGDARTRELAARHCTGDECYPQIVTLGDFLKIAEEPGFDPAKTALFMPTATGPCRFGQYAPLIRRTLSGMGLGDVAVVSPTCDDGYRAMGANATELHRYGWWALVAGDLLRKLLHRTRPYELEAGTTDALYEFCVREAADCLARKDLHGDAKLKALARCLAEFPARFRAVDADYSKPRLFIGVVGEIFCRLNIFSNDDILRRVEAHGGEVWVSDIGEWIFYSNFWEREELKAFGRRVSKRMVESVVTERVQKSDEHLLAHPFREALTGLEEPDVAEIVGMGGRYIPPHAALGEMVLNLGKAVHLHRKGADAVMDISPFSCMNGIVSEAVYPKVSRDLDGLPIRPFYFDGSNRNLDEDVSIFMELAAHYSKRKKWARKIPNWFGTASH